MTTAPIIFNGDRIQDPETGKWFDMFDGQPVRYEGMRFILCNEHQYQAFAGTKVASKPTETVQQRAARLRRLAQPGRRRAW